MYYTLWEMKDMEKRGTDEVKTKTKCYLTNFIHVTWNDSERLLAREICYAYGTCAILCNGTACID